MPVKKSAIKALRQDKKRALRNSQVKKKIKKAIKITRKTIDEKKSDEAKAEAQKTIQMLDKADSKGVMNKNTVARKKSRLMKELNSLDK